MTQSTIITLITLSGLLIPAAAAEPSADQLLRQTSAKLAFARSFTFHAHREIDAALRNGRALPERADIAVTVRRPNELVARSVSNEGARRIVANGRTLTVFDERKKVYGAVPMRTSLDGLVATLDAQFGFTPPLAEFVVSDPGKRIRENGAHLATLGREKIASGFLGLGSEWCHHIAVKGAIADADLWIGVNDSLPRKLVASFHRAGRPQVRIDFTSWNLTAPVSDATFAFTPPSGSEKVEMWTTARMEASARHR